MSTPGYFYVIQYQDGMVKLGKTVNAQKRVYEHRHAAHVHGNPITDVWLSPLLHGYGDVETMMLEWAHSLPQVTGPSTEYFYGLSYRIAVLKAQQLIRDGSVNEPSDDLPRGPESGAPHAARVVSRWLRWARRRNGG